MQSLKNWRFLKYLNSKTGLKRKAVTVACEEGSFTYFFYTRVSLRLLPTIFHTRIGLTLFIMTYFLTDSLLILKSTLFYTIAIYTRAVNKTANLENSHSRSRILRVFENEGNILVRELARVTLENSQSLRTRMRVGFKNPQNLRRE